MNLGSPLALYARWQLRDAVTKALIPVLIFTALTAIPLWSMYRQFQADATRDPGAFALVAVQVYGQTLTLAMTLGALLLMSGLVSADREKQHFRFLFSRPVAPWMFYLQQFVISLTLFAAAFALISAAFGAIAAPVPVLAAVQSAAMYAFFLGSLALLCSVLVNKDGVLLVIVLMVSLTLQQVQSSGVLPRWTSWLADALPPIVTADAVRARWLAERAAESGDIALVLLYSLGMLGVALFLLRRAPLAR